MTQARTATLDFMLEICICEGNAVTLRCSPVLKQYKVLLQVQVLGLFDNQLEGGLPEIWSDLSNVSPHGRYIHNDLITCPQSFQHNNLRYKECHIRGAVARTGVEQQCIGRELA